MNYKIRNNCRLCFDINLTTILQLPDTPLANEFVTHDLVIQKQEKFPLYLSKCNSCGHVQLPVVVSPNRLFSEYVYVSGTSPNFVNHFNEYASDIINKNGLKKNDLVVEVGSNDGTLLNFFKLAGMSVLGIDPAKNIAKNANELGINTICEFFNQKVANSIILKYGLAKIVIANNVFAHSDDLHEIALGVKLLLDPINGQFVFEVQYLLDLIDNSLFDMIYHEHLSYHSLIPLITFFNTLDMKIIEVKKVNTHGGSIRVTVSLNSKNAKISKSVKDFVELETNFFKKNTFDILNNKINIEKIKLKSIIEGINGKIIGYGAPAKLTTLMYRFNLNSNDIAYIVDDSPWKQGLFSPGLHIPIVSPSEILNLNNQTDFIIIFAWNFADSIVKKFPDFSGKFIVPLPTLRRL